MFPSISHLFLRWRCIWPIVRWWTVRLTNRPLTNRLLTNRPLANRLLTNRPLANRLLTNRSLAKRPRIVSPGVVTHGVTPFHIPYKICWYWDAHLWGVLRNTHPHFHEQLITSRWAGWLGYGNVIGWVYTGGPKKAIFSGTQHI